MNRTFPLFKRIVGIIIAFFMVTTALTTLPTAKAETLETNVSVTSAGGDYSYSYSDYLNEQGESQPQSDVKPLGFNEAVLANGAKLNSEGNVELPDGASAEWVIDVPTDGYYHIFTEYGGLLTGNNSRYELKVLLNGKSPFFEAGDIELSKAYQNESGKRLTDDFGNALSPYQIEFDQKQSRYLQDNSGYFSEPYRFYFKAGENRISLEVKAGGLYLHKLALQIKPDTNSYESVLKTWKSEGYTEVDKSDTVALTQGEDAVWKTESVLYPHYDNTSAATIPSNPSNSVLNTIGGQSWNRVGQSMTWQVNVEKTGLYKLSMRVRQNFKRGVQVSRRIYVNGEVPYSAFDNVRFPFDNKWYVSTLSSENEPLYVLLNEGDNVVTMEVVPSYPEVVRALNGVVLELNAFYRSVIMITGTSPDTYQDYDLDKNMAGFGDTVKGLIDRLNDILKSMENNGFQAGGEAEIIDRLSKQLDSFIKEPDKVPFRMNAFQNNVSGLASWAQTLSEQPLEVDWISAHGSDDETERENSGFFGNIKFVFRRLLASFFNDYNTFDSGENSADTVNVWLSLGRDQAQVLKRMTDDVFKTKTGHKVSVSLVQQSLIPATLAGTGPDIAVFIDPATIINLAARNALSDLSRFPEMEAEIPSRFQKASLTPFKYKEGIFALPVAETFFVTFYRKDIFSELGIKVPETWEDFYGILKILQRNHLQAGVPSVSTNAVGSLGEIFFQNLLYQHGGSYYKNGWESTGLDSDSALDAMTQWTDFYTKYSLITDYDFYSRFRTGEMPIGFEAYTFQNQLSVAAPELKGMWGIAPLPGLKGADGEVNNTVVGTSSGIIMFKKAEDNPAAWDYLKWFTDFEAQEQYSREIEALMGPAARHPSANIEAMAAAGWDSEMKEILLDQWRNLEMVEQTPVSYYVSRNITNIFRNIVYYNKTPREVMSAYNRDINREIARRRKEFGLEG